MTTAFAILFYELTLVQSVSVWNKKHVFVLNEMNFSFDDYLVTKDVTQMKQKLCDGLRRLHLSM